MTAAARHVFISYSRDDGDFAQILRDQIQAAGFPTWKDLDMSAGQDWRSEIDEAIKSAVAAVVVMSPQSKASEYVNYEWAFALGAGVKVIPVLLRIKPTELHPRLSLLQPLDFTPRVARPWDMLIKALQAISGAYSPSMVVAPRDAPPVVQQASRALDSLNDNERSAAIASLGQMNHPAAIEVLAGAVKHPIREVRISAAVVLARLKDPRAVPGLLEGIRTAQQGNVRMLSELGRPAVGKLVEALLDADEDPLVRCNAAWALGEIGDSAAQPALREALRDQDSGVSAAAAEALTDFRDPADLPLILESLHDEKGRLREGAVKVFKKLGGDAGVAGLIEALQDEDREVRNSAAWALKEVGNAAAVPALLKALQDAYDQTRAAAAEALQNIGDPAAVPGLLGVLHDESNIVYNRAFEALGKIGGAAALTGLLETLRDEDAYIRGRAAEALGNIRDSTASTALLSALRDEEVFVRQRAAEALGQIGDANAIPGLLEALDGESADVRREAAGALKRIGTPEAKAALKAWQRANKQNL